MRTTKSPAAPTSYIYNSAIGHYAPASRRHVGALLTLLSSERGAAHPLGDYTTYIAQCYSRS
jgi:hypothetical protein